MILVRNPNPEQKAAIEHDGGVLLNAGAGSGKTFVLVEHLIYRLKNFLNDKKKLDKVEYDRELKMFLSKIVYMTFSKKSAGELKVRIKRRVDQEKKLSLKGESSFKDWQIDKVIDSLNYLTIKTIHGFFLKIIKEGYIPVSYIGQKMISSVELTDNISKLLDSWLESFYPLDKNKQEIKTIIIFHKDKILSSMLKIFESTDLRVMWDNIDIKFNKEKEILVFKEIFNILGINEIFSKKIDFENYSFKKMPAWFVNLEAIYCHLKMLDMGDRKSFYNFYDLVKRTRLIRPGRQAKSDMIIFYKGIKRFKDVFIKETKDYFESYFDFDYRYVEGWGEVIREMYHYIRDGHKNFGKISFSDLEYIIYKNFNNEDAFDRLRNIYQYFVVDEFQDTSKVQFEILKKIIGNDYKRLFCVGDSKQAIYGFRGGSLSVYKESEKCMPSVLSLKYNYRSSRDIVEFNNSLFSKIFFDQKNETSELLLDPDSINQDSYLDSVDDGKGFCLKRLEVDTGGSDDSKRGNLSQKALEKVEAKTIVDFIEKNEEKDKTTCILYKKTTPIQFLLKELVKKGISFTCQLKVRSKDDPFIRIFYYLICPLIDMFDKKVERQSKEMIINILEIIKKDKKRKIEDISLLIDNFYQKIPKFGIWESFKIFLFDSGVRNSNQQNNYNLIKIICETSMEKPVSILQCIDLISEDEYSINFERGAHSQSLKIMTVHAAKGLEFDRVILGGIHSNGRINNKGSIFGKLPMSFKWWNFSDYTKINKTLHFIYEKILLKYKNDLESKRLLYVACTRPQEQLIWVDIKKGLKEQSYTQKSWISDIRSWEHSLSDSSYDKSKIKAIPYRVNEKESGLLERILPEGPAFHRDSLGLEIGATGEGGMSLIPELSVTKFATLLECQKKFYFSSILKIDEKGFDERNKEFKEGQDILSSAQRGSEIHDELSKIIKGNLLSKGSLKLEYKYSFLTWVVSKLQKYQDDYKLISEEPIKFSFFNFMISGTPDLVILPNNLERQVEIWDFKTGSFYSRIDSIKASYWFQLKVYAYGLSQKRDFPKSKKVKLVLCFLDKEQVEYKEYLIPDLKNSLYRDWTKLRDFDDMSDGVCHSCPYGRLCR